MEREDDIPLEAWRRELASRLPVRIRPIRFGASKEWTFRDGVLRHNTGRFFSVVGVRAAPGAPAGDSVAQPLIDQPEIGILGLLLRRGEHGVEALLQAKAEPGNIGGVHLAPTVQATQSNYEQVHHGRPTPYLDFFLSADSRALDELQTEQGRFFLEKRNRNMAAWVDGDVEAGPEHRWTPMRELLPLLHREHVVNSDLRSVLACLDWSSLRLPPPQNELAEGLLASLESNPDLNDDPETDAWLLAARARSVPVRTQIPLDELPGWNWSPGRLEDDGRKLFRVIQLDVQAPGREVDAWDQPMIACRNATEERLPCRFVDGRMEFLVALRSDPGVRDGVELGLPTSLPPGLKPGRPLLRMDTSEEGGRFFQVVSRYSLSWVDGCADLPADLRWLTLRQLKRQIALRCRVSNELRGAAALLLPFLAGAEP